MKGIGLKVINRYNNTKKGYEMDITLIKGQLVELVEQKKDLVTHHTKLLKVICGKVNTNSTKALWNSSDETTSFGYVDIKEAEQTLQNINLVQIELKICEEKIAQLVSSYSLENLYKKLSVEDTNHAR